jgi:hypothetical protein
MMKKKIKMVGMPAALLSSAGMTSTAAAAAVAQDDLLQDAGSWAQIVAEGSLKVVDPSLEKARVWVEGQSRWDDNWTHWYQGMARASAGPSIKISGPKEDISISIWTTPRIPITPCTT